jgi:chromatin structure-remodeling complex subunit SFH1
MNDALTKPETFAKIFCHDLDIPLHPWADTVANQIRAQLEEHESVAALELGSDGAMDVDATLPNAEELSECRVILSVSLAQLSLSNISLFPRRSMSRLPITILWTT